MSSENIDIFAPNVQPNIHLTKKINKLLETRLDNDKDMIDSLKSLSSFSSGNSLRNRRNLRSNIERRSLVIAQSFVEHFTGVDVQIQCLFEDITKMNDCCKDMKERLHQSKSQTQFLISQTTGLKSDRDNLQMKCKVVHAFLDKFQLTPEQVKILRTTSNSLDPKFFEVLKRVKNIHTECKILLRTNHQTAGLEIMESMALFLETAYEKLYRWSQNECRQFSCETPSISQQFCNSINALLDRPVLFKYTMDEYATARRTAIVRGFIDALTRGGSGSRPIELHSHDPLRYVGDMLAWLHQSIASESEYIDAICKQCTLTNEIDTICIDILGHITEGLCRPLKVRCEQVLLSEPGAVELYKLSNLIHFYCSTISDIKKSKISSLLTTMDDLRILSTKMFYNSLHCHSTRQMEKIEYPPNNLGATSSLSSTLTLLREILSSQDNALIADDLRREQFHQILSCVIDPLIQTTSLSASQLSASSSIDTATFMINSLHLIASSVALYAFTGDHLENLQMQIQAHVDTMVAEQASSVLNHAGLGNIYNCVEMYDTTTSGTVLSATQGMDAIAIKTAMKNFDLYLSSPDIGELPQCSLLLSAKIREEIKLKSGELIHSVYSKIYVAISSASSGYNDVSLLSRQPDQVKNLLSL